MHSGKWNDGKNRCPVQDCQKSYKTQGWLALHLKECHPIYEKEVNKMEEERPETKDEVATPDNKVNNAETIVNENQRWT